jgi:uncharacterized OsmC-like protein
VDKEGIQKMAESKNASHPDEGLQLKTLNGVDLNKLVDTIRAIQEKPELANFQFRVTNRWVDGGHNKIQVEGYYGAGREMPHNESFHFDADEPPVLLGKDQGANPVEYLLTALSACMTTTMAYHAAANGIQIEGIESTYEGDIDLRGFLDLDPSIRKGYREIRVNFKVKTDADRDKLEMLARKSPVFDVVTNPTPVRINVETTKPEVKDRAA